jgi:hypothetical protein
LNLQFYLTRDKNLIDRQKTHRDTTPQHQQLSSCVVDNVLQNFAHLPSFHFYYAGEYKHDFYAVVDHSQ